MKPQEITATVVCGALYAAFGYITYLGLFTPVLGVVRFWPAVIVPGAFAVIYGPKVGGLGAAIGIFISDVLIHGDAFLSLTVGVTSNLVGFYLVGYISRRRVSTIAIIAFLASGAALAAVAVYLYLTGFLELLLSFLVQALHLESSANYLAFIVFSLFLGIDLVIMLLVGLIGYFWPRWRSYGIGAVIGLMTGSLIIGFGLWAFSQFFVLPPAAAVDPFRSKVPLYAALIWLTWTFSTEIPFLVALVPPVLSAVFKAFPRFQPRYLVEERNTP